MSKKPVASDAFPADYANWLADLKQRVAAARQRAALAANAELVTLYWQIGNGILQRQRTANWGDRVLDRLASDLRDAFPEMKGFSRANLKFMRAFAQAWPDVAIGQHAVSQLPWGYNVILLTKPTIGLLLCKTRKRTVAEYALSGIEKPIGVAEYRLLRDLPQSLIASLPTVEQLESELGTVDGDNGEKPKRVRKKRGGVE